MVVLNAVRIALVLASACVVSVSAQRCPVYWTQRQNGCYRFTYTNLKSWSDAEAWCKSQSSDLIKIEDVNERTWIVQRVTRILQFANLTGTVSFWTGLNKIAPSASSYTWADKSPVDARVIQGQLISQSSTDLCVKIDGTKLHNVNCATTNAYVCKRPIGVPLTCDSGWQSFNNFCYKTFGNSRNSWDGAQKICDIQGGNLFTAGSVSEEQTIQDMSNTQRKSFWIGVRSYPQGNSYTWLTVPDNSTLNPSLSYWSTTPQLQSSQYNSTCVAIVYNPVPSNILWQTADCNTRYNFVCKKAQGSCQPGWVPHQNKCYQINSKSLMSWQQSNQFCKSQGGMMVEIFSAAGTTFLMSYLEVLREDRIDSFWIGATDNNTNNYTWASGRPMRYRNWIHTPPTNTRNRQDCVYISTTDTRGKWRPTPNCGMKKAFICTIGSNQTVIPVTTPQATLRCDAHWTLNSGVCFQFNDTRKSWINAQQDCRKKGGDLATIDTNAKHSFVINRIGINEYWFGLNDKTNNGQFLWSATNVRSMFFKWCPGQPNEPGTVNCVEYINRCWRVKNCAIPSKYICQKPPVGVPTRAPVTITPMPFSLKCGSGWEETPTSQFCYQFHDDQVTWSNARQVCRRMGGELASIHSPAEQVYINTRTARMTSVTLWLGGTDVSTEGGWTWTDRTPFNFAYWAPGEPNDMGSNEDCMGYYVGNRAAWNDFPCNNMAGFICKKSYGPTTHVTPRPTPRVPPGQFLGCQTGWIRHGNSCWLFSNNNITADAARTQCQSNGGYLATVNSRDEQNFVRANIPKSMSGLYNGGSVWIGLSDRVVENYFVWDDGTPVLFTNWNSNEPNNYRNMNEDCVSVWLNNGAWNDMPCGVVVQGYVCQKGLQVVSTTGGSPLLHGCTNPNRGLGYGSSCYAFMDSSNSQATTWQNAQNMCKSQFNGQLATINNRYVQAFLASNLGTRTDYFWIGLSDQKTPGTYSWIQGQNDYFTFWYTTHKGTETNTCVAMRTQNPIGLWENKQCTESHNYICEIPRTGWTQAPATVPATIPCPAFWTQYGNFCYKPYLYYNQKLTWEQSRDFCRGLGGDLLSIHDQNELNFVKSSLLTTTLAFWIGLNDRVKEGGYVWSDGTGFDFSQWSPNEPNNFNDEDCVQIVGFGTYKGTWNDNNCFLSSNFICKIARGNQLQTTAAPPTGVTSSQCGTGSWLLYNGACYMTSPNYGVNSSLSWYQARQICMANGADLASIHSQDENNFLLSQVSRSYKTEFWIGLNELEKPGKYQWIDGSVLNFISWNGNEPNDAFGGERCVGLMTFNGNWNDDNCNEQFGFICKKLAGQSGTITPQPPVLIQGGCANSAFVAEPYGNKCFYASNFTTPKTWNDALNFCRTNFGSGCDIAAINNEIEQAFLTSLVQGFTTNVWIGLNNLRHHSTFVWQDNSAFFYTNWNAGEPNGKFFGVSGSEDCVEMYVKGPSAGMWNDNQCSVLRNVVCQGPKVQGQQTASPQGTCTKSGYVQHGTSCYKFVKTPVQTWQLAENICQGDGGVLASVNNIYENSFIESQMGPDFQYWIGLQYNKFANNYNWQDSWPVSFTNWGSGEPSQGPSDRCVRSKNGLWDDTTCTLPLGYVCEINSVSPPVPTAAPAGHCRNPDDFLNGDFCYYFSPLSYQSWPNARFTCNKRLMELVSITSADELQFVWTVMLNARDRNGQHTSQNIWIGLSKGLLSGFTWSDNSPFSYSNWNAGEPSDPMNATTEECVEMYRDNAMWNDVNCFQTKAFACKARALLGSTAVPPSTTSPQSTLSPVTQPNVPSTQTKAPVTQPNVPVTAPTIPTLPNVFTRTQGTKLPIFTFNQPTGFIAGPKGPAAQNRILDNSKVGLTGASLVGTIITITLVIGVVAMIGILYWKKRNPTRNGGGVGFENALYSKGNEQVNIQNSEADA